MAIQLQVIECETWGEAHAHGMNHPPGCFYSGQTPVRERDGVKVGGGVWIMAAPVKSYNGENFVRLKVGGGQTPREGVLIPTRLFKRDGWEKEIGVNWTDEGRFPIQAIMATADADHGYNISIVMDLDSNTGEFHHRLAFITTYRG